MTNKPTSRKANIVVQEMDSEILIYDLSINKAYCLNQTAGLVFQLCDGKRTVAEISDLMSKELKMLVSEDCIWLTLNELKKDGLLENANELANHFAGLTRREVVKRVGLASMVMLPLISSVVAPNAAMAQSGGIALFGACPFSDGPGCQAGLNCKNCSGPCSVPNWCCASGVLVGGAQGRILNCSPDQTACGMSGTSECCDGMASLTSTVCPGGFVYACT